MATKIARMIGMAAAMAAVAVGLTAAPASATARDQAVGTGTVRIVQSAPDLAIQAGWLGNCYPAVGSNWGGGWCDGNGPNWNYQGWVDCSNGWEYYGVVHWAGDRRGSYAYCPTGTSAVAGGIDVFYLS
ncbi:hypothetical protein [Lentzea sp. NPDC059081]|uniref:hypothetical protein n=1 Tax=Lentzea sp. NPDC059081 TaxID=3346719 RepID=UPI003681FEBA